MKLIKRINFKLYITAMIMAGIYVSANASVCSDIAGGINCNSGTVNSLSANGMATAHGTGLGSNGTANRLKAFLLFLMALTHHVLPHLTPGRDPGKKGSCSIFNPY